MLKFIDSHTPSPDPENESFSFQKLHNSAYNSTCLEKTVGFINCWNFTTAILIQIALNCDGEVSNAKDTNVIHRGFVINGKRKKETLHYISMVTPENVV
jgi:hypothetical protein